jgi:hypothetical protein
MYNLSGGYFGLGRFQEALEMAEKALEQRRRVLPADHSDIGCVSCF